MSVQLPLRTLEEEAKVLEEIQQSCMRPIFVSARNLVTDFTVTSAPVANYNVLSASYVSPVSMSIVGIEGAIFIERGAAITAFTPRLPAGIQISFSSTMFWLLAASNISSNEGNVVHHQYVNDTAPTNIYQSFLPKGYFVPGGTSIYFHMFVNPEYFSTYTDAYFNLALTIQTITTGQKS